MRIFLVDGGVMRASFVAGVYAGLLDSGFKHEKNDVYLTTSGGAFNSACHITGQIPELLAVWEGYLTRRFIRPGWILPHFNLGHLEWVIRCSDYALDVARLREASQQLWVTLAHVETCETRKYLVNTSPDPVKLLLAGVSLPWGRRKVTIGETVVCDGGLGPQPPIRHVAEFDHEGAELWFISPYPLDYQLSLRGHWILSWLLAWNNPGRRRFIRDSARQENQLRQEMMQNVDHLHVICPPQELSIGWTTTSRDEVRETIQHGFFRARQFMRAGS